MTGPDSYTYAYPRPMVTVDVVIFTVLDDDLKVLLIGRREEPFKGMWALPGGFVREDESLDACALRELEEETGVRDVFLEQLYTFGAPDRDPRGRVITVAYFALVAPEHLQLEAGTDAERVEWWPLFQAPELAFDHQQILDYALERLRNKLEYTSAAFQLLPEKFTFPELQRLYEIILQRKLDKRNFRKRILNLDILEPLEEMRPSPSRPARLYRFAEQRFFPLKEKGILFPLG